MKTKLFPFLFFLLFLASLILALMPLEIQDQSQINGKHVLYFTSGLSFYLFLLNIPMSDFWKNIVYFPIDLLMLIFGFGTAFGYGTFNAKSIVWGNWRKKEQ